MLRALIADDHPMCREFSRIALAKVVDGSEVFEAATLDDVLAIVPPLDLIILDLKLPNSRGTASLVGVTRKWPDTPILVVTGVDTQGIEQLVADAGASGYVSKSAPITDLIEAIRAVLNGDQYFHIDNNIEGASTPLARLLLLTPAEARVLRAMSDGRLNKQIAFDLDLSEITVKQHVKAILRKLGVVNRTQAILLLHAADG